MASAVLSLSLRCSSTCTELHSETTCGGQASRIKHWRALSRVHRAGHPAAVVGAEGARSSDGSLLTEHSPWRAC